MDIVQFIYNILKFFGSQVKTQWKGFVVAGVIALIIWLVYCWPIAKKYADFGQKVGTYRIPKGQIKTVASNELEITFRDIVYHKETFLFPVLLVWNESSSTPYGNSYSNFEIGQRLLVRTKYYYYTIELIELDTKSKDTIAYLDVYRNEIPAK